MDVETIIEKLFCVSKVLSQNLCGINVTYGGRAVRMKDGMRLMVDM